MTTIAHEPPTAVADKGGWSSLLEARQMWAGLAIAFMWVAVLFAAVFGPDIVSSNAGTSTTIIPSAVAVALFAAIGTRGVAKYGFGQRHEDGKREEGD
jgi:hypothetical protein